MTNYTITTKSGTTYTVNQGVLWRNGRLVGRVQTSLFFDGKNLKELEGKEPVTIRYIVDNIPQETGPAVGQYAYFSCREEWWWSTEIADVQSFEDKGGS